MRDVPTMQRKEEYVPNTEQRERNTLAAMKDVTTKFRREEYVEGTAPRKRRRLAAMKDVLTNYVVKGGVCIRHGASWTKKYCSHEGCTIMYKKEDFVWGMMVKKYRTRSHKDVPIKAGWRKRWFWRPEILTASRVGYYFLHNHIMITSYA